MPRSPAALAARASSLADDIAGHLGRDDAHAPPADAPAFDAGATAVLPELGLARLLDFVA